MRSWVAYTDQLDDIESAVEELFSKINGFSEMKNSVGILSCYADMDLQAFVSAIASRLPFDVIGCTRISAFGGAAATQTVSACLTVLSADDCCFSVGASDPIAPGSVCQAVTAAYNTARAKLPDDPKLIYVLPPYDLGIMLDEYCDALNRVAPEVPVIGGVPSNNGNGDLNAVFANGSVCESRMALLLVSGNVRPVFSISGVEGGVAQYKRKVTKAHANAVYEVGGERFTDYLKEFGFDVEALSSRNTAISFVTNPLILEISDDIAFVRMLHKLNIGDGSGTAIGSIPEGAFLSICAIDREAIVKTASAGIRALLEEMAANEKDGYRYTTILAVSCIGRFTVMLPDEGAEVRAVCSALPEALSLSGFYGYGEIGPLSGGCFKGSFSHNESLVFCAL